MSALHNTIMSRPEMMTKPMLEFLSKYFWDWYRVHSNEEVITIKIWLISKKITVAMARPLFIKLFGQEVV